jgi:hypothetical protein
MNRNRTHPEHVFRLLRVVSIAAIVAVYASSAGQAVEIQPGQLYASETRLEAVALGVAFTVPKGWQGALPVGSEVFVLQPEADPSIYILAMGEQTTRAELASTLAAPIALGDGLSLHPTAAVADRGKALVGRYEVGGAPNPLVAYAEAQAGSHGVAVAYILIAPPASLAAYEPVVRALISGTDLGAPAAGTAAGGAAAAPNGGSGSGTSGASGSEDRWDLYLKGKYIVYYYTASGYTDEQHLWLCSDGSFKRTGAGGGFGGGASGAFQGDSIGRWQATGAGEFGVLTLHYGDGSTARHELRWDYAENALYLDGTRWLHGDNGVCN